MILVTGATGTIGGEVVRQLLAAGQPVRALVRPASAVPRLGSGAEIAVGDAGRPETLKAALRGVERMYLLLPMVPALRHWDAGVIAAAQSAGVGQVVKHSNMGHPRHARPPGRGHPAHRRPRRPRDRPGRQQPDRHSRARHRCDPHRERGNRIPRPGQRSPPIRCARILMERQRAGQIPCQIIQQM